MKFIFSFECPFLTYHLEKHKAAGCVCPVRGSKDPGIDGLPQEPGHEVAGRHDPGVDDQNQGRETEGSGSKRICNHVACGSHHNVSEVVKINVIPIIERGGTNFSKPKL